MTNVRFRAVLCLIVVIEVLDTTAATAQADQPPTFPDVDTVTVIQLELRDGTKLIGRVMAADDTSLTILTPGGLRAVVPHTAIRKWQVARGRMVDGSFRIEDPNATRLFFTATGRTLDQGQGYFADYFLFFPFLAYGFHDRLTVAGGMSLIPGVEDQLVYIAPKVGLVRSDQFNLAVGGIYATVFDEGSVGAAYAVATVGNRDNAVSLLVGYPFSSEDIAEVPGFILGGETRVSGSAKLLAELWKLPDVSELPIIFGMRIFGSKLAVDFGLVTALGAEIEGFPFLPWVDFVVNW